MVITEYVGTWRSSANHVDEETPGRRNNRGVAVVDRKPSRARCFADAWSRGRSVVMHC